MTAEKEGRSLVRFTVVLASAFVASLAAAAIMLHFHQQPEPDKVTVEWIPPKTDKWNDAEHSCFWMTRELVDGQLKLTVHRLCLQRAMGDNINVTLED